MENLPRLRAAIASSDPTERYWGVLGLRLLGEKATSEADSVLTLLKDKHAGIRTTAAQALNAMGKKDIAAQALIADFSSEMDSSSLLNLLNTLRRLDLLDQLPKNWANGKNIKEGSQEYIQRFKQHKYAQLLHFNN